MKHAQTLDMFPAAHMAAARRDLGIERAGSRADRELDQWTDTAARAIADYASRVRRPFLVEEVRDAANLPAPPDGRAWGAATRKAASARLIRKIGFAPSKSSNLSPKVLWGLP